MKLQGPIAQSIIDLFKGVIDIYPRLWPDGKVTWIARKWPRKPTVTAEKVIRSRESAKETSKCYSEIPAKTLVYYRSVWHTLDEYPIDYWRAVNQSYTYHAGCLPCITNIQLIWFDNNRKIWFIGICHHNNVVTRIYYQPAPEGKYPTYMQWSHTRKGPKQCLKMSRTIPPNSIYPYNTSIDIDYYHIPDKTLIVAVAVPPFPPCQDGHAPAPTTTFPHFFPLVLDSANPPNL